MQGNSSTVQCPQLLPSSCPLHSSLAPLCTPSCRLGGCWGPWVPSPAGCTALLALLLRVRKIWALTALPQPRANLISELALASLKLCELWDLLPSACCSWAAGPQVVNGTNKDTVSVCAPGVGREAIFRKPGWEHHAFRTTRKSVQVLGCANREINSQAKTMSLFTAYLLSYSSKCCLSSVLKCTPSLWNFTVGAFCVTAALVLEHQR